jgi:hypothetical protein
MSDKESTLKLVDEEYEKLREALDGLSADQLSQVWFGTWGVKDIIAHVLGWEHEMTALMQRLTRGERPTPEGVDYSNGDEWNAKFALAMAPIDPPTVLANWRQVHMNFVNAAKAVPDDRYGEGKTVNRVLDASGYGHYRQHAADISEWRKREGL